MAKLKPIKSKSGRVGVDARVVNAVEVQTDPESVVCAQVASGHLVCLVSKVFKGAKAWQQVYDAEIKAEDPKVLRNLEVLINKQSDPSLVDSLNTNPNVLAALSRWAAMANRDTLKALDPQKYQDLLEEKGQVIKKVLVGFDSAVEEALTEAEKRERGRGRSRAKGGGGGRSGKPSLKSGWSSKSTCDFEGIS